MKTPAKPAFTRADLQRWKTDMLVKGPVAPHIEGNVQGLNIVSFVARPSANGMHVLIHTARGDEVMLLLNPVVAKALRDCVLDQGQQAGWLDEDGIIRAGLE